MINLEKGLGIVFPPHFVYDFSRTMPFMLHPINPIQGGSFRGCSRMDGGKKTPLFKICHTYPTMMKLGTLIPYLKMIQKIYKSRNKPLDFC